MTIDFNKPLETAAGQPARRVAVLNNSFGNLIAFDAGMGVEGVLSVNDSGLQVVDDPTGPAAVRNTPEFTRFITVYTDKAPVCHIVNNLLEVRAALPSMTGLSCVLELTTKRGVPSWATHSREQLGW